GSVQTAGDITTTSDNITFQSDVTLTGDVVLDTGIGGGDINLTDTLDGNHDLTLIGGTGDVEWNAGIGGSDSLANFIVSGGAITANGKTTVDGTVSITGCDDVNINAEVDPTTVTLSSEDDINIGAAVTADNTITVAAGTDGSGSVNVTAGGSIETTEVGSDVSVTAGNTAGDINLAGDVTAVDKVTVNAAAGAISQSSGLISGARLDLDAVNGIHDGAGGAVQISAVSIGADNAGAGDVNIENTQALDTDVTSLTTQGGDVTFIHSGGGNLIISGTVSSGINPGTDGGDIYISSADLLTVDGLTDSRGGSGGILTIAGAVLNVAPELGAGDISLLCNALDVIINTPMIWVTEIIMTAPRDIIVQALMQTTNPDADIKLYADFDADGVGGVQIDPAGKIDSARDVIISGSDVYATSRAGDSVIIENDGANEQVLATRNITIQSGSGAAANADIFIEGVIRSSGNGTVTLSPKDTIYLESNLLTAGGDIYLNNPLELTNDSIINSGNGEGDIIFNDVVNGGFDLWISADDGDIEFNGPLGDVTALDNVTINGAGSVTTNDTFTANVFSITNGGIVDLNGLVILSGDFASSGSSFDNTGAAIATNGGNIAIDHTGDVTIGGAMNSDSGDIDIDTSAALTLDSAISTTTGSITIDSDEATVITAAGDISTSTGDVRIGLNRNGEINSAGNIATSGGNVTFDNATILTGNVSTSEGNVAFNNTTTLSGDVTTSSGSVTFNGATTLSGNITTSGGSVTLDDVTILTGDVAISTGDTEGDIAFNGALDGGFDLVLAAGTGSVAFAGEIGSHAALGDLSVEGASSVTAANTIHANQVAIINGGVVDLNGAVTADGGFNSTGSSFDNTGAAITTNGGNIVIDHTGNVTIGGALNSAAGNVDIDTLAALTLDSAISTTTGSVTLDSDEVTTITSAGDISTTTGDVWIGLDRDGEINSAGDINTSGGSVTFDNATTLTGDITTSGGNVTFDNATTLMGDITTSGGDITFDNAATLTGDTTVDTGDNGGDILFNDTLDGGYDLSLTAGEGSITLEKAVGNTNHLETLLINSASSVTVNDTVESGDFIISEGGNVDLNGAVTATGGFYSSGSSFDNTAASITTADQDITIQHSGDITIGSSLISGAGNIAIDTTGELNINNSINTTSGSVSLDADGLIAISSSSDITTGTGNVYLGTNRNGAISTAGDITTDGGNIIFGNETTLTGSILLDTGAGSGDIAFHNSVDGGFDLAVWAGTGNLEFQGLVGAADKLGDLTVQSADDVTADESVYVDSFTFANGTGDVTFSNDLITQGDADQPGGAIQIVSDGNITFGQVIDSSGGDSSTGTGQDGGEVVLISNNGSITVGSINTSGSAAVAGDGGSAGDITLQACKELSPGGRSEGDYLPVGLIQLNGDMLALGGKGAGAGADGIGGNIDLGLDGRTSISSIATITGNPSGGDVAIQGHSISMGQNEKFTVLGNLTLTSDDGVITVGDLTTQGDLTVDAGELGTIILLCREIGDVRLAASAEGGVVQDAGLDFVAGGDMIFIGTLELAGIGENKPQFAALDTDAISKPPQGDPRFIIRQMHEFPDLIGSVLDGVATGQIVGTGNSAGATEAIAGAMSHEISLLQLISVARPRRNEINMAEWEKVASVLEKLRIKPRYLRQDEILQGWAIYDDYFGTNMPSDSDRWITANRLDSAQIQLLAKKLKRFIANRTEKNTVSKNAIQEDVLLNEDLSQIAASLALLDQLPELTALEKEQLIEQVLHLTKPREFDMAEFRDKVSQF
ncbi:MAG: hypothetical protein JXD22_12945, partial [Sedimentisphaerales bacterium]|nr:hypothetical protein [Sedimentisphaerales bacterium]